MKYYILVWLLANLLLVAVMGVFGQEFPSFRSAVDTIIPKHTDLDPIKARAGKEYDIISYIANGQLVIQIPATEDYVYIYSNGRMVVASERNLSGLMDKDSLIAEVGQIIGMIDEVSNKIDTSNRWDSMYLDPVFYSQDAGIYKAVAIWGYHISPFSDRYLLHIPDMQIKEFRLTTLNAGVRFEEWNLGWTIGWGYYNVSIAEGTNSKDITDLVKPGNYEFDVLGSTFVDDQPGILRFEAITEPCEEHITVIGDIYRYADRTFQCRHITELFPSGTTEFLPLPATVSSSLSTASVNMPSNSAVYTYIQESPDLRALADILSSDYTHGHYSLVNYSDDYLTCHFYPGTGDLCYVDAEGKVSILSTESVSSLIDIHVLMAELKQILGDIQGVNTNITDESISKALYEDVQFYNNNDAGLSYKRVSVVPTIPLENREYEWTISIPENIVEAKMIIKEGIGESVELDGESIYTYYGRDFIEYGKYTYWADIAKYMTYGDHNLHFSHPWLTSSNLGILEAIALHSSGNFRLSGDDSERAVVIQSIPIERLFNRIPILERTPPLKGDVNNDGKIRSNDAILALRIAAGLIEASDEQLWAADMNDDGKVRSNDAILMLREAAGLAAPPIGSRNEAIAISLDRIHDVRDGKMILSLKVDKPNVLAGGDLSVTYDSSSLWTLGIIGCPGIIMASSIGSPGLVHVSFAGMDGLSDGTIANIAFDVLTDSPIQPNIQEVELYGIDARPMDVSVMDAHFPEPAPDHTDLLQNFPNSFNPDTWIPYQLAEDVDITIRIYDAAGHIIRSLNLGHKPAGFYTTKGKAAYWDGRNESGEQVASGIYFYTIQAGDFTATKKMIIAR